MLTPLRAGVFVFLALLILSSAILLIGNKDFLFSSTYRLKADFENVGGLNNGAEVRIGGTHQGTVKEIDLPKEPDGKVVVVMNLRSETRNLVKKDSRASLKTEGLLGDKYVEISFGSTKAEAVRNDETIATESSKDLSQEASMLADEAREGIGAFRDDMEALQSNFLLRGFFQKRGYKETSELKENAISRLPAEKPVKEFEYDTREIFDKADNAKLKNKKSLDQAGKYLEENPFGLAVISDAEAKGDTAKDRVLSEARAKVIRDYLTANFRVDDKRIKTMGLGKSQEGEEGSRVEILVYSTKRGTRAAQPSAKASD